VTKAFHNRGDAALAADLGVRMTDNPLKRRGVLSLDDEVADQCPIDDEAARAAEVNAEATDVPLVMLGQGDYVRKYPATTAAMSSAEITRELIGSCKTHRQRAHDKVMKTSREYIRLSEQKRQVLACESACFKCRTAILKSPECDGLSATALRAIRKAIDGVIADYAQESKLISAQMSEVVNGART